MRKRLAKWLRHLAWHLSPPTEIPRDDPDVSVSFSRGPLDGQTVTMKESCIGRQLVQPVKEQYGITYAHYTIMSRTYDYTNGKQSIVAELYPTFTGADLLPI
jgi:hypothetical protein